jgi:hypothetical protein
MAQADPPALIPPGSVMCRGRAQPGAWVFLALGLLLVIIGFQLRVLWREWDWLQAEWSWVRRTAVIGYPNISPRVSYAQPPENWLYHEEGFTYLWGGWDSREGHRWFRVVSGDLNEAAISLPMGRDVFRAIDAPLIEAEGGPIWGRIPSDAPVVGVDLAGVATVYPLLVLDRVQVVNDLIAGQPILVTYNAYAPPDSAVKVYEAQLEGRRVTLGTSGYYLAGTHLLYDRESESLWKDQGAVLKAIGGPRKGQSLRQVASPAPVSWGAWRWRNPKSRLLVGADRSRPSAAAALSSSLEGR